jgi:hypothetical protein
VGVSGLTHNDDQGFHPARERAVSNVLIDLGELTPDGARRSRPVGSRRRPRPYRSVLAVLAAVLVASLSGAVRRGPPDPPRVVAARLGDTMYVGTDRFYVVSAGPEPAAPVIQKKIISAYGLPAGNLLSQTTVSVSGVIFDVTSVDHTILVSYQVDGGGAEATVALAAGTPSVLWRRPARLLGVSASDGLVLLRENSADVDDLHWYGIDLASGDTRWQLEQPVHGYITETGFVAGFPRSLVTVDSGGRLDVRATATGAITASTTIAVPADWAKLGIALWPDGDLVLVGDHISTTAYALPDLAERWHSAVDLYTSYVGPSCGDAVCFFSPRDDGMRVLDRVTGRDRWSSNRWSYADQVGPYLLAGADGTAGSNQALDVVDTDTGRVRGDFGAWQRIGEPLPDGTVVGLRQQLGDDVVAYARLDPANLSTRVIGVAEHVSGDCQTTTDVLICRRTDASVGIWRLQ